MPLQSRAMRACRRVVRRQKDSSTSVSGWLKRGYYPFNAPPGYLNRGRHKLKDIDPRRGPLIVLAFELYGSGRYSLEALRIALAAKGLTRRDGSPLLKNSVALILRNPFYMGLIRIAGETFEGVYLDAPDIDGVVVHGYAFDLSHPDLAAEEEALADYLFGLTVAASSGDGPIEEAA